MRISNPETINIGDFATTGEGVGRLKGKTFKVIGALPKESASVCVLKRKKGIFFAEAVEIANPAIYRRASKEEHFLSGSPWQIISEDRQLDIKKELAVRIFRERAGALPAEAVEISASPRAWGYRNKMEFSFTELADGQVKLAFHKRYRKHDRYPIEGSQIAPDPINAAARRILAAVNENNIPVEALKTLVVRYSFFQNSCVAVFYVKNKSVSVLSNLVGRDLSGFAQIFSDPRSPASVKTQVLYSEGNMNVSERICGKEFEYPYDGFFQVNPKAFELLIGHLKRYLEPHRKILDLYSGVGTIGILLSDSAKHVTLVESHVPSAELAEKNVKMNRAANISVYSGEVEKQDLREMLRRADILVVDPPRSGLHPRLVRRILENPPEQMLYVSCNPHTQADDWRQLQKVYSVEDWRLFDLYPQTPHMESVLVLKKRD